MGGALRKAKKKSPKKDLKLEQALATQVGGALQKQKTRRYHDSAHKYLMNKLSGRGGHMDSAECRGMLHHLMRKYDPSFFNSYLSGTVKSETPFPNDVHKNVGASSRRDPDADITSMGGSLRGITHSENGFLVSHDAEFHHNFEIV